MKEVVVVMVEVTGAAAGAVVSPGGGVVVGVPVPAGLFTTGAAVPPLVGGGAIGTTGIICTTGETVGAFVGG